MADLNNEHEKKSVWFSKPLIGDWLLIMVSIGLLFWLYSNLWKTESASKLLIRQGGEIHSTLSLNQDRTLDIHGPLGDSRIIIKQGKVRFEQSPCTHQYCVHQGWLKRAGQVAICLPNQVSLELLGAKKSYDSLNY